MAKVSQMQGIPAHLETLRKKDKRRHPSYCIYHEGKGKNRVCKCIQSQNYSLTCSSARYCEFYVEEAKK